MIRDKRFMVKLRILMLGCLCAGCLIVVLWNQNHLHRSLRSLEGYHGVITTKNTTTITTTRMNFTNYAFALMTEPRCYAATRLLRLYWKMIGRANANVLGGFINHGPPFRLIIVMRNMKSWCNTVRILTSSRTCNTILCKKRGELIYNARIAA